MCQGLGPKKHAEISEIDRTIYGMRSITMTIITHVVWEYSHVDMGVVIKHLYYEIHIIHSIQITLIL